MQTETHVPPLQTAALLAMLHAPTGMLVRRGRSFTAAGPRDSTPAQEFTKRLVFMLDRDGLVHLDDDEFPETCTLNRAGRALAERIRELHAKAVRA